MQIGETDAHRQKLIFLVNTPHGRIAPTCVKLWLGREWPMVLEALVPYLGNREINNPQSRLAIPDVFLSDKSRCLKFILFLGIHVEFTDVRQFSGNSLNSEKSGRMVAD